jgi:uncharacterized RDD family membrane protein YckC
MNEYPSFSSRFGAWAIDGVVLFALAVPIVARGIWSLPFHWAAAATVGFSLVWYSYKILTQAMWGKTIGKKVVGIRLRMKDGSRATWSSVLIRYLPGLAYASLHVAGWLSMVRSARFADLQGLPPAERVELIRSAAPFWWPGLLTLAMSLWLLVNAIVLGKNAQNRAVHDLIAGTTVRRENG